MELFVRQSTFIMMAWVTCVFRKMQREFPHLFETPVRRTGDATGAEGHSLC